MSNVRILVIVEYAEQQLKTSTVSTIEAARQLKEHIGGAIDIVALVSGKNTDTITKAVAALPDISHVIQADHPALQDNLAEPLAAVVCSICTAEAYQAILAPATTFGKNILPRIAAMLDVAQISDVIKIMDAKTFVRPTYAGNIVTTVRSLDTIQVITVRSTHFTKNIDTKSREKFAEIVAWPTDKLPNFSHLPVASFIERKETKTERPDLATASIVVAGGRGLGSPEQFSALMTALADKLGAAIGASRAAVDAGFAPNDAQVGQTGKVVAPKLYIAVGISGAIQHLAGMKDSKVVVAINKDPSAPIFQVSNYGLVGDLFEILPNFLNKLEQFSKK
ncbi:MAG: hypothetical protein RLZ35_205 [Pseudomonadota bacterium]|jgi:electron transfer flavoprotein alpha subunit